MNFKEKYDNTIESLLNKKISTEELINHLIQNRFKVDRDQKTSLCDVTDGLTNLSCKIDQVVYF